MPVWTKEDIRKCRERLYPNVTREDADALFAKWGGVPRFVLRHSFRATQQQKLELAISSVGLNAIMCCASEASKMRMKSCSCTFTWMMTHSWHLRFASAFVVDALAARLLASGERQLLQNFLSSKSDALNGGSELLRRRLAREYTRLSTGNQAD